VACCLLVVCLLFACCLLVVCFLFAFGLLVVGLVLSWCWLVAGLLLAWHWLGVGIGGSLLLVAYCWWHQPIVGGVDGSMLLLLVPLVAESVLAWHFQQLVVGCASVALLLLLVYE